MIATKNSIEPQSGEPLPNSSRVHVPGKIHPDVRVPLREIKLSPTKSFNGKVEANAPCASMTAPARGAMPISRAMSSKAAAVAQQWILARGDVEHGRAVLQTHSRAQRCLHPGHAPAPAAPRQARQGGHAIPLRPPGHHHPRDGIHRHPREPRPRASTLHASRITFHATSAASPSAPPSPPSSRPSSSAPKSPAAAPSSRPTSTTPRASR